MKHLLILGGGTARTMAANRLRGLDTLDTLAGPAASVRESGTP